MLYDAKKWDKQTPVVDEIGKVLLRAADIIQMRGWCQGDFTDSYRRVCAEEAILLACPSDKLGWDRLCNAAMDRLRGHIGRGEVHKWNDGKHQSMANVVASIRAAATSNANP